MRKLVLCICFCIVISTSYANDETIPLQHMEVDITNHESLQRGARLFMNYCAGCHSLKYFRYTTMAEGLGISRELVAKDLIFTQSKISDTVRTAMPSALAKQWFGDAPPDLTLEVSVHGADWIYTYLKSFYKDPKRPFGSNNLLYPDVAMPNVLAPLQGEQIAVYTTKTFNFNGTAQQTKTIDYLQLVARGSMRQFEYDAAMTDLVNFLSFVADPIASERETLGYFVIGFLLILLVLVYLLKKSYWKEVK